MKKIDPFYYLIRYIILYKFFQVELYKEEIYFINSNINKHRKALWLNLFVVILILIGLNEMESNLDTLVLALVAPVMIMGTAWFAVSFGGIPAKLINSAMSITFWMFSGFIISLSVMLLSVAFISPAILWPVLTLIFITVVFSCIQYDTADGLKAGLDDAMLKHSRAALIFYKKQGIEPEDNQKDSN